MEKMFPYQTTPQFYSQMFARKSWPPPPTLPHTTSRLGNEYHGNMVLSDLSNLAHNYISYCYDMYNLYYYTGISGVCR
jgi:hypothetical protein